jgi:hypothetical protein
MAQARFEEYDRLNWLCDYFLRMCDGDWERCYQFTLYTVGNPGWTLLIDLTDTKLGLVEFTPINIQRSEHDWCICSVKDGKFKGSGGPKNLSEVIDVFRAWVEEVIGDGSPWDPSLAEDED